MRAFEVISDPESFCQGVMARNSQQRLCNPTHKDACQWSAGGAIRKVYRREPERDRQLVRLLDYVQDHDKFQFICDWNDEMEWGYVHKTLKELNI